MQTSYKSTYESDKAYWGDQTVVEGVEEGWGGGGRESMERLKWSSAMAIPL